MDTSYNPKKYEEDLYQKWEQSGYFNPDNLENVDPDKTFSVPIAPVNITGKLHMGHALEDTLVDILVRKKRMEGYKLFGIPELIMRGLRPR